MNLMSHRKLSARLSLTFLLAFSFPIFAAATAPPAVQIVAAPSGIWILNLGTGRVAFCHDLKTATTGLPIGMCQIVGNVGTSSAGYALNQVSGDLMIVANSTGAIFQCEISYLSGSQFGQGSCVQISTTASLQ
jgi:hypothetical protein